MNQPGLLQKRLLGFNLQTGSIRSWSTAMTLTLKSMWGWQQLAKFRGPEDNRVLGPKAQFRDADCYTTVRARLGWAFHGSKNPGWEGTIYKVRARR